MHCEVTDLVFNEYFDEAASNGEKVIEDNKQIPEVDKLQLLAEC